MNISIIGQGKVGTALGTRLAAAGHSIRYAGRDNVREMCTGADAIIVAATPKATHDLVEALAPIAAGTVIIDAMNSVSAKPEGYATSTHAFEALLSGAHVVKCFNSVGYEVMADPVFGDRRATMFMAGDDARAKDVARALALDIGFGSCEDIGGSNRYETLEQVAMAWISMAIMQGKGRAFAWHLLER